MNNSTDTHLELPLCVEFDFTPGTPGRITGPPEDCYPPEGAEIDITAVYLEREGVGGTTQRLDIQSWLSADELESLKDAAMESLDTDEGY